MSSRSSRTTRSPQLDLRIEGEPPDPCAGWGEGRPFAYLGRTLALALGAAQETRLEGDRLCLPLPPDAAPRQVRDRAEAWLREEALRLIADCVARKSAPAARHPAGIRLAFAARAPWAELGRDGILRCNWRLVEQAPAVVEQAIERALRERVAEPEADLFALA